MRSSRVRQYRAVSAGVGEASSSDEDARRRLIKDRKHTTPLPHGGPRQAAFRRSNISGKKIEASRRKRRPSAPTPKGARSYSLRANLCHRASRTGFVYTTLYLQAMLQLQGSDSAATGLV